MLRWLQVQRGEIKTRNRLRQDPGEGMSGGGGEERQELSLHSSPQSYSGDTNIALNGTTPLDLDIIRIRTASVNDSGYNARLTKIYAF